MPLPEAQAPQQAPGGKPRRSLGEVLWRILTYRSRDYSRWAIRNACIGIAILITGLQKPDFLVPTVLAVTFLAILTAWDTRQAVLQSRQRKAALAASAPGAVPASSSAEPYAELQAAMRQLREREEHLARNATPK
jgi:hypothetical protein